ncbi:hypothetical protein [Crossiella cryophila]|uniref:Uncharacterized protein n=1 Tax=Crossiella cryophila TaxID=43355 RepID=A0A7W7CFF1_9PSEU|nr:hypothetical protein [Crossiella cryophila]MBB4680188.1 hypothetical protein [Crossiella cryophila]
MQQTQGRWAAMVEQSQYGQEAYVWALGPFQPADSREHARAIAAELARDYRPTHPRRLRRRTVLRQNEDVLFVVLEGMTSKYHLRISVVELIADLDADGRPFS